MDAGGAECAVGVVLSAGGDHRPLHSGAVSGAGESDTGGGQPHGEKIFRRMAGELQVCPAGMAAHAGGAGSVRL